MFNCNVSKGECNDKARVEAYNEVSLAFPGRQVSVYSTSMPLRLNVSVSGTSLRWKTTVRVSPDKEVLTLVISIYGSVTPSLSSVTVCPGPVRAAPQSHPQDPILFLYGARHSI